MKGRIGVPVSNFSAGLGIRPALMRALSPSAPLVRRELRVFHGKNPVQNPFDQPGDDVILEIRRLHEQASLPARKILAHLTDLGHDRSLGWIYQTIRYHNRSHLVPALGASPYLTESLPCAISA